MLSPEGHSKRRPKVGHSHSRAVPLGALGKIRGVTEGYGQSKPRGVTVDSRDTVKAVASGQVERWGKGLPTGGGAACERRPEV